MTCRVIHMPSVVKVLFPICALAVQLAAGVGAVRAQSKITYEGIETRYDSSLVSGAGRSGEMTAEVHGNPFQTTVEADAIAGALRLPGWFRPAKLTTRPTTGKSRLVLIFNPVRRHLGGRAACRGSDGIATGPPAARMRVQMAFCTAERLNTELVLEAPAGNGPDDPTFRKAVNDAVAVLLPSRNPLHEGKRRRRR